MLMFLKILHAVHQTLNAVLFMFTNTTEPLVVRASTRTWPVYINFTCMFVTLRCVPSYAHFSKRNYSYLKWAKVAEWLKRRTVYLVGLTAEVRILTHPGLYFIATMDMNKNEDLNFLLKSIHCPRRKIFIWINSIFIVLNMLIFAIIINF